MSNNDPKIHKLIPPEMMEKIARTPAHMIVIIDDQTIERLSQHEAASIELPSGTIRLIVILSAEAVKTIYEGIEDGT